MKKLILIFLLILSFVSQAQSSMCDSLEVIDISYSNSTGEFILSIYYGDSTQLNYPGVAFTLDSIGDTLQKAQYSWMTYFHHLDTLAYNYTIHNYPNTINPSFPLSVYFTYSSMSGFDTCVLTYSSNSTFIEQSVENTTSIYPNPTNGIFTIQLENENIGYPYQILDNLGRLIDKGIIRELSQDFDLSDKPKGVYRIQVSNEKAIKTLNVVIQ